ncbi:MAG TPA: hypothetical protein VEK11_01140, partial [Thermoanaerobaculia bacterium]|nr:hypothetical protein [Thermoanaerobaculia bacterium]
RALRPYGGLANRWFQPLTHLSGWLKRTGKWKIKNRNSGRTRFYGASPFFRFSISHFLRTAHCQLLSC